MVLRGRFTRLHHIPDHERWDSVICMQTWYEAAIYAYSFPGFSPTRHRSWRREPWKRGCSCDESRSLKQIRRRRQQQRQKTIGLMSKTKVLHVYQDFSTFLWRPLHDYDVKLPNATWKYDDKFSLLYLNVDKALNNSSPGKVAYIWRIERFRIDAIKFERTQINFFSDVFTAVVVVVA